LADPASPLIVPHSSLHRLLEAETDRYRNQHFITHDPMQFAHAHRLTPLACEYMALLSALLSYGRRSAIIAMLTHLLDRLNGDLLAYLTTFNRLQAQQDLAGFYYRFNQAPELVWLLERLAYHYHHTGSLETLWPVTPPENPPSLVSQLDQFLNAFIGNSPPPPTYGARYLLTHPSAGGACKRWMLFLRWVVRQDDDLPAPVDFGLWRSPLQLTPAQLVIPLDTHVGRLSRQWGLTQRTASDWRTAQAITDQLRHLCPTDPLRYDFAFMGVGIRPDEPKGHQ
jgi:uncharacterized protein (TIGR02757 family)